MWNPTQLLGAMILVPTLIFLLQFYKIFYKLSHAYVEADFKSSSCFGLYIVSTLFKEG